jgi:hypothetical protein
MLVEIPKLADDDHQHGGKPGWVQPVRKRDDGSYEPLKPVIRCNCGRLCGIGLHHVHADGTVTASFYHSKGTNFAIGESPDGCGWHVFLKLLNWTGEDFPPNSK